MKKVLFTSHVANFSKFNWPLMEWFQKQGWEVHYASLDEEEIPCCDRHFQVSFHRSPYHLDNIKAYFQLKKIISQEQYRIIHCHTPMGGVVTRLAASGARRKGTKVLYTAHGFHFYQGAPISYWLIYYPVEKFLSCITDCIITLNEEDYQIAKKRFHSRQTEKISSAGVDLERFRPAGKAEKMKLRQAQGIREEAFVLLYTAEFILRKNHDFFIRNIPFLKTHIPELKVILLGKGRTFEACRQLVQQLGLSDTVFFFGYRKDVERFCQSADLVVSVSRQEGLPVNLLEGMASGLPVVCTKIRGQVDLIEDGKNGFLFPVNDSKAFRQAILQMYQDAGFREKSGNTNRIKAQNYSKEDAVLQMAKIYFPFME